MNKILITLLFILTTLITTSMLVNDSFIQIFILWTVLQVFWTQMFHFKVDPFKNLAWAICFITIPKMIASSLKESFIVDWGLGGAPIKCGGFQEENIVPPTNTAVCDIWTDPQIIVDQRIDRVLKQTKQKTREMEDFLHVDTPNKIEVSKDSIAQSLIV